MRAINRGLAIFIAMSIVLMNIGCGAGVRGLTNVEKDYFTKLGLHLQEREIKMKDLLSDTSINDEKALKEIARLDNKIRMANMVYSVREVLTAPKDDRAEFIQLTRNKVILYHLFQVAQARSDALVALSTATQEQRRKISADYKELIALVKLAVESNQLLHNYLNKPVSSQLFDVLAEADKQIVAFNVGLKEADQDNSAIKKLVSTGQSSEDRIKQTEGALNQFNDIWLKLNKK